MSVLNEHFRHILAVKCFKVFLYNSASDIGQGFVSFYTILKRLGQGIQACNQDGGEPVACVRYLATLRRNNVSRQGRP